MLKLIGFFFAISIFASDEKEVCHTKLFLGVCSIVRNAVSICA
jgi:hypothetical protein